MTALEAAYTAHTPGSAAFLAAVDFAGRYQGSVAEKCGMTVLRRVAEIKLSSHHGRGS